MSTQLGSAPAVHVPVSPLLAVRRLDIESRFGSRRNTIVAGLDLHIEPGETIGIVGESGSGKSMTARALIGLLPEGVTARGEIFYQGRDLLALGPRAAAQVRGHEIGLILQDPYTMLNPLVRCGRHITEVLEDGGGGARVSRRATNAEARRRLAEVGIPDVGDSYPFQLSGGMRQRVAIAAALAGDPKVLIADEPSTALDVTTQKEILALLTSLQESRAMALVLITHDLRVAFSVCDRIYVLYAGSLLEVASAADLEREPFHPYTLGLLLSEPPGDRRRSELLVIPGTVPAADDVATCCGFSPRCAWSRPRCRDGKPPLEAREDGRASACVRFDEIRDEMAATRRASERSIDVVATPPASAALVRIEGLEKVFEAGSRRHHRSVTALAGVSLSIGVDEGVGVVGESGSGKTTLARCLVGLETPTAGEITIDAIRASDYQRLSERDRTHVRRTVQIVFQDPYSSLNPVLSVGSTLREAVALYDHDRRRVDRSVGELLERVGLPAAYATRKPVALSGGERQRVAIARALAVRPRLIICDEPVSALDVSIQAQVLNLLKELRRELGMSYLFITHDLAVVRQVVERVYVIFRGEVVEEGAVDEVLDRPSHPYTARLVDSVPRPDAAWLETA